MSENYTQDPRTAGEADMAPPARESVAGRPRIRPRSPRQAIQPEQVAPPPARSRQARHPIVVVLNFFLMTAVLAFLGIGIAMYLGKVWFESPGPLTQPTSVLIARGASVDSIAAILERQNVISSDLIFNAGVQLYKAQDRLKAGEYMFEPRVSMRGVMDALVSGKSILHAVTIPEGYTSEQIIARLRADESLTGDITEVPPEGALLPETYKFTRGTTRAQVVEQMKRARDAALDEVWERRAPDLPVATKEELVTLASIVEKETGKADERPRVAGVFISRLDQDMKLQSDPTIIYGLFGGKGKPADRPIYQSDIEKPTPYNTYVIEGLPPGPIANPGRAALEAVANPSRTGDLYFVADGSGGHVFAKTLEEHNRNVEQWRRIEKTRAAALAKAAAAAGKTQEGSGDAAAEGAGAAEAAPPPAGEEPDAAATTR